MAKFHITKPQYTYWEWFTFIGLRVIFPPVLIWDLLKYVGNWLFGEKISKKVLPAQGFDFSQLGVKAIPDYSVLNTPSLSYQKHTVITHDGAELDTLEITQNAQMERPPEQQKYIISFPGNLECYETKHVEMAKDATELNCHVVGFNYRGVRESTGSVQSKHDLVTDGIAQVQRLLDQGVLPKHITLKGFSLGASIATLITAHFHQLGMPINVFNNRSFSSISDVVIGTIKTEPTESDSIFVTLKKWVVNSSIKLALALTQWDIHAGKAMKRIPEKNREYIVVRTPKASRNESTTDDGIIPHYASIHMALKEERQAKKALLKDDPIALEKEKDQSKQRKMENTHSEIQPNHVTPLFHLQNRFGKSADTFFYDFVKSTYEEPGADQPMKPNPKIAWA